MHQFKANSQVRARQRRALTDVVTLNKRDNNALDSMQQTSPTSQQLIILRFSQNDGPNHLGMILGSRSWNFDILAHKSDIRRRELEGICANIGITLVVNVVYIGEGGYGGGEIYSNQLIYIFADTVRNCMHLVQTKEMHTRKGWKFWNIVGLLMLKS